MLRAAMPVAAVYEDSDFCRTEDQVRRPAEIRQGPGRDAVAETLRVDQPADEPLGLGVTAADRLHVAAACCGRSPGTFRGLPFGIVGHTEEGSPVRPAARGPL